jgi:hypothetical protein
MNTSRYIPQVVFATKGMKGLDDGCHAFKN